MRYLSVPKSETVKSKNRSRMWVRFKDNDPISDVTRRVHVTSDQHGGSKLIIQDVETSDQGVYSCQAVNAYDKTRCTVSLRVARKYTPYHVTACPQF